MQTFLPNPSFEISAQMLDYRRLGNQRKEVLQLLQAILGEKRGWVNHPAAKMWRGHTNALVLYGVAICKEWVSRGYKDTCLEKIQSYWQENSPSDNPVWMQNEDFFASHRSNLLRKQPEHYSQFNWGEPDTLEYVWPV